MGASKIMVHHSLIDSKPTSSSVSKSVSKRKISNNIWDEESSSSEAEECVRVRPKKLKSVRTIARYCSHEYLIAVFIG